MARKFRPAKFLFSISVFSIIGIIILASVSENDSFGVILDIPTDALVTFVDADGSEQQVTIGDFEAKFVACWVQDRMFLRNSSGEIIDQIDSPIFKVNPIQANTLIDAGSGALISGDGGFAINPQIRCTNTQGTPIDAEQFGLFELAPNQLDFPMFIEETDLVVRIYSGDANNVGQVLGVRDTSDNIWHDTYNARVHVDKKPITSTDEVGILLQEITDNQIIREMEDGDYFADQLVTLDGIITIGFECGEACTPYKVVIPLATERTFVEFDHPHYLTNNWKDISNPVLLNNKLHVVKNVVTTDIIGTVTASDFGEGDPEPADDPFRIIQGEETCLGTTQVLENGACRDVTVNDCEDVVGFTKVGILCVPSNNVRTNGINTQGGGFGIDIIDQLTACVSSGDPTCLATANFLPLYIGAFGLIIVVGGLAQSSPIQRRTDDIYGVPNNF